ncbi:MAG: hypothetical protein GF311_20470 [Candidatus Lokiarchaeota archaeon]|nr:hypothetical protein [Candidatus Lokiarchaeota archaeon]
MIRREGQNMSLGLEESAFARVVRLLRQDPLGNHVKKRSVPNVEQK